MQLALTRSATVHGATIGQLYDVTDPRTPAWLCWTLEDAVRPVGVKVDGQTAIPEGRYALIITLSARFGVPLPLVLNVPNFTGIRIHAGNTTADTAGCILVGQMRGPNESILNSRAALATVQAHISTALLANTPVTLTITNAPVDPVA